MVLKQNESVGTDTASPALKSTGSDTSTPRWADAIIRFFGWRVTLLFGDPLVLDRWLFLVRRLPRVRGTNEKVLDIGCGTGAMTIGIASRGYTAIGLSWDARNQAEAARRAGLASVPNVSFPIGDARRLDERTDWREHFDVVVCFETIEHILDDRKLIKDIANCLKPGGRLLLTTPNYYYRSSNADMGPFRDVEDGWHVRRGYTSAMLQELCDHAGLTVEEFAYVSWFFSQLVFRVQYWLAHGSLGQRLGPLPQWLLTAPLRILPILLDGWLGRWLSSVLGWPGYSIAMVAYKPRFGAKTEANLLARGGTC